MTSTPARRGRPPVHSRTALLDAARVVLMERGLEGLRYQDVSRAAGVPVASLRHYFPTIADLRIEALRAMVRIEHVQLARRLEGITDPRAQLDLIVELTVRPDSPDGLEWLLWLDFYCAAARDPEMAADKARSREAFLEVFECTVRAGIASGDFHPDGSVEDVLEEMMAIVDGYGAHLATPHTEADDDKYVGFALRGVHRLVGLRGTHAREP